MRALIQKVKTANVAIEGTENGRISRGFVIFLGIEEADAEEDIRWLVKKITNMRIFEDEEGKMNLNLKSVGGDLMIISQFTLHASTKKGNRPSFIRAANPDTAIPLYESFIKQCEEAIDKKIATGEFGAQMDVSLTNEGPVTIWLDSKQRE